MTSTPLLGREAGRLAQGGTEPQGERPLHVPVPTRGDGSAVRTIRMEYVCPPPGPTLMVIEWVRQLGGRLVGMRTPRSIYLPSRGCYSYIYFIQRIFNFISRTCYAHACKFASWRARERELLACFSSQNAACGVLLRAVWLLSLLALACAVPRRNALACLR